VFMALSALRTEWDDLLERRPAFRATLDVYGEILDRWGRWAPAGSPPLGWAAAQCHERWERGVPLLAEAPPPTSAAEVEELLGALMERLAEAVDGAAPALQRVAEAWDRRALGPADFLPTRGRIGSGEAERLSGLSPDLVAFLAYGTLRPALETYLAPTHAHLDAHVWKLGACPFCGGPPSFSDVLEDGRRRLACHLCGGGWLYSRVKCPFCGADSSEDLVRLEPSDRDQGYVVIGCNRCRMYVKELDRRVRWNAQSALIEDWGSPHFDLVASRAGYRRPTPSLSTLTGG
jgi:FdhE protein